jgi:dienelactone hydrolase
MVALAALAVVGIAGSFEARDHARGGAFVIRAADMQGWPRTFANAEAVAFREHAAAIPSRHGSLRARIYRPGDDVDRAIVLVPGVHAAGIDEPRLIRFAREVARAGVAVVAADLPELMQYRVTPRVTDMIEDAIGWTSAHHDLAPDGRAAVMGISFAGGLGIVAAGRPAVRDRTVAAISLGGHGDLLRVLKFLCTGALPDRSYLAPHDYGVVIVLLNVADQMVPADQVEPLRHGIRMFLQASHADMVDKRLGKAIFERARKFEDTLPSPARELMHYVNTRDVKALGPRLVPYLGTIGADAALSPEKSTRPAAEVFLLHGTGDNVIPAQETSRLADYMRASSDGPRVRALISPLITHAEVDREKTARDVWNLVRFWTEIFDE